MWTSFARAGLYLVALVFLMFVVVQLLGPIVDMATSGPHSSAESVKRVGGYFNAMTLENLTLLAGVAVGIYLLGRAAVERDLG